MKAEASDKYLARRVEELEEKLAEAEQIIEAVKAGEVDAFALNKNNQAEVLTLQSGDYAYRVLVENFNAGALNLSEDGLIVYTNGYFHELLDLPYEKVIGSLVMDFVHPESKATFSELFKKGLTGQSKGEVKLLAGKKGIPVYVSFTSLYPHLHTVSLLVTDLSEKKEHEKTLAVKNELQNIFQQAPVSIVVWRGENFVVEAANAVALDMWGKTEKEVLGEPFFEISPELRQSQEFLLKNILKTGKPFFGKEFPATYNRHGKLYSGYFDFVYQPILDLSGNISGIITIGTEVTESVLSRKKIEESEKTLRDFINKSPTSIVIISGPDLTIELVNEKFLIFSGMKEEQLIGKPVMDVFPLLAKNGLDEEIRNVMSTGQTYHRIEYEVDMTPYGGLGKQYFDFVYQPLKDEKGNTNKVMVMTHEITDLVTARQEVEESEERFRLAIETTGAGIFDFNIDTNQLYWSERMKSLCGYKSNQVITPAMAAVMIYPDDRDALLAASQAAQQPGSDGNLICEFRIIRQNDGQIRWLHVRARTYFIEQGNKKKATRVSGIVIDITQQKQAEEKVRQSEEKNRLFIEYAPAAMAMFDKDMRYISVSKQWMKEYDLTGNIIGRKHYDLFPNILQRWKDVHARCLTGTIEKSDEDFYVKDDGTPVWLKWEVHPWYNANKEICGIVIFTENITERKKAGEDIKESEERFRSMANEAPLFVWETDEKLKTTYLNKAGLNYFGFPGSSDITDLSWKKYIHPDDLPKVLGTMHESAKEHEPYTLEMRLKNGQTGEYRWFLDKGAPRYAMEKFIGFVGTSLDIHEKKIAQLATYNQQREELRRVIESDKLKDDFIKMASHELKTPVTSIKGYVQLLLSMVDAESKGEARLTPVTMRSSLSVIEKQVSKLTRLLSELLDLSRIEAGQLELKPELFNLNELVGETVQEILYSHTKHKINIQHDHVLMVHADRDRIAQVLVNLLINAIKYSPDSYIVDVRIYKEDNWAVFSVQDYGIGISKSDQGKIFDRFFRSEGENEKTFPGFGIGLYIAHEIIQRHGGEIWVNSEKNKGSIFNFKLPLIINK